MEYCIFRWQVNEYAKNKKLIPTKIECEEDGNKFYREYYIVPIEEPIFNKRNVRIHALASAVAYNPQKDRIYTASLYIDGKFYSIDELDDDNMKKLYIFVLSGLSLKSLFVSYFYFGNRNHESLEMIDRHLNSFSDKHIIMKMQSSKEDNKYCISHFHYMGISVNDDNDIIIYGRDSNLKLSFKQTITRDMCNDDFHICALHYTPQVWDVLTK